MDEKSILVIFFTDEEGKWRMWLVKFMAGCVIKVHDTQLQLIEKSQKMANKKQQ